MKCQTEEKTSLNKKQRFEAFKGILYTQAALI